MYEVFYELGEENYPIVRVGDSFLSPKFLDENNIPIEIVNTYEPDWVLLKERINQKYNDGKIKDRYTTNGKITAKDILDNANEETDEGYRYMLQEHNAIRYMVEEHGSESI